VSLTIYYESNIDPDLNHRFSDRDLLMRYHLGLGIGHLPAHLSTSSYRSMSMDAQDEPVPESLPIGGDVRTTDVDDDEDEDESDNSEMGLEDREGLDDLESDNSSEGGKGYHQDSDDYDDN
jgi:hypothetical protein